MTEQELVPFDYSKLPQASRLQELANQGRAHLRRSREEVIAFGNVLIEGKGLLPMASFELGANKSSVFLRAASHMRCA